MANINFIKSAKRHYDDAKILLNANSVPNAGQLFGFCAECGLKALLIAYGLTTDPSTGDLNLSDSDKKKYLRHINVLCNNISIFTQDTTYASYLAIMPSIAFFLDWRTDHRYYDESAIPNNISKWENAATEVRRMVDKLIQDGRAR